MIKSWTLQYYKPTQMNFHVNHTYTLFAIRYLPWIFNRDYFSNGNYFSTKYLPWIFNGDYFSRRIWWRSLARPYICIWKHNNEISYELFYLSNLYISPTTLWRESSGNDPTSVPYRYWVFVGTPCTYQVPAHHKINQSTTVLNHLWHTYPQPRCEGNHQERSQ